MSYPKIYEMYEYFVAGEVDKAIMQLFNILSFAPLIFRNCKGMGPDIVAIEEWAQIFKDKPKLISTVTKHFLMHKKEV